MWTYEQTTGILRHDGLQVGAGYSGAGPGKNNPKLQRKRDVGPIPQGDWNIAGLTEGETPHGPYVLHLTPAEDTKTFDRDGFLIHGDSLEHPGEASKGCVIMGLSARKTVWASKDRTLRVIA